MAPGVLYVTMHPSPTLAPLEFQDWYNNEHGPLRLRLSSFVSNGFRYKASDLTGPSTPEQPEWMAIYDITDMDELTGDEYMQLRDAPVQSQRERDLRPSLEIDRRSFDLMGTWEREGFRPLEDIVRVIEGNVLVAESLKLQEGHDVKEFAKWFAESLVPTMKKTKGWLRTRRFVTSTIDKKSSSEIEHLALHEFEKEIELGGQDSEARGSWTEEIVTKVIKDQITRKYALHYRFGPAPRDLSALANDEVLTFDSPATRTKTFPSPQGGAIESYVTTADGVVLPYRLEGSSDPDAPVIVLSNSILVEWGIWDGFISSFFSKPENKKFRVLRYQTRGRYAECGSKPVNVDLLGGDIITLLDALRIPRAAAAVGVSLGGATVLCAGLKYPERIARIVACDTSSKSPEGNSKLWKERIAMSEKEGMASAQGEGVVGDELAEVTVRRWFVKESYDGGKMEEVCERVKQMVVNNSREGFKRSVEALWEYDLTPLMKGYQLKGAFLVGSGDGVLPKTMKAMAEGLGESGSELFIVDGAGHLPMVEKPGDVADAITKVLEW